MGFNGVRKHQKIEDPRYLYWADRLGLLVWEEMPSAYRFTDAVDRAADARVDRGDRARLQPPVHRRLGAVQRVVGRARTCPTARRSATTCRRSTTSPRRSTRRRPSSATTAGRASPPTSSASTTTTTIPSGSRAATTRDEVLPQLFQRERPGGRAAARSRGTRTPASRSCSPSSAASRTRKDTDGTWGYSRVRDAGGVRASATPSCSSVVRSLPLLRRLLLHAVHRHVPGEQRAALRRPHAEVPARADPHRDARAGAATATRRSSASGASACCATRRTRRDAHRPLHGPAAALASAELLAPDAFVFATGIEDTFITAPWPPTGRTLDEYELTGHYERWPSDLERMRELGVTAVRYGIPWHRMQPRAGPLGLRTSPTQRRAAARARHRADRRPRALRHAALDRARRS